MIYPGKKKPEMIQVAGKAGQVQSLMDGNERIYSTKDTKKIVEMAKACKTTKDLLALGKYVLLATKKQDAAKPQFTNK